MSHFPLVTSLQTVRENPMSCVTSRNMSRELLATQRSWETNPCGLPVSPYSIYLPLTSISGARLIHLQSEDAPLRGDHLPT